MDALCFLSCLWPQYTCQRTIGQEEYGHSSETQWSPLPKPLSKGDLPRPLFFFHRRSANPEVLKDAQKPLKVLLSHINLPEAFQRSQFQIRRVGRRMDPFRNLVPSGDSYSRLVFAILTAVMMTLHGIGHRHFRESTATEKMLTVQL